MLLYSFHKLILVTFIVSTILLLRFNLNHIPSWSNQSTSSIIKCTGTPEERRALALLGDSVSPKRWRDMTQCMIDREKTLTGVFALHISKSGGTSLCNLFKTEKCFVPPSPDKESNCWYSAMKTTFVDFSPKCAFVF